MQTIMTDSELRSKGVAALADSLGTVEAERFITLMLREPFDYTDWRRSLFEDRSLEEISKSASKLRNAASDDSPASS